MEGELGTAAAAAGGIFLVFMIVMIGISIFSIVVGWKIFTKAGEPGWAIFVPIYQTIVYLKICGRPWWWLFLCMLVFPMFILPFDLAKRFGKGGGFGVGLLLLSVIFYPILAFGSAQYIGDGAPASMDPLPQA